MQIRPVVSSILPGEHLQVKLPRVFTHSPPTHGCESHSFKSTEKIYANHIVLLENT